MVITSVALIRDAYTSTTSSISQSPSHPTPALQLVKKMDFHLQVFTMALNTLAPVSRHVVTNHWMTITAACHVDQPRKKCVAVLLLLVCIPVSITFSNFVLFSLLYS